jgi:sec-independent protein translocase protein TatA
LLYKSNRMGNIGWTGIIIIAILVVILFGKGKISSIMGDLAKGIKSFKKGLSDDNSEKDNSTNNSDNSNSENK